MILFLLTFLGKYWPKLSVIIFLHSRITFQIFFLYWSPTKKMQQVTTKMISRYWAICFHLAAGLSERNVSFSVMEFFFFCAIFTICTLIHLINFFISKLTASHPSVNYIECIMQCKLKRKQNIYRMLITFSRGSNIFQISRSQPKAAELRRKTRSLRRTFICPRVDLLQRQKEEEKADETS